MTKIVKSGFIVDYVIGKLGECATANTIHEVLGISLSYIYVVVRNENIRKKSKYNRAEYNIVDFLKILNFSTNYFIIDKPLSKDENYRNNFYNWGGKKLF